MHTKNLLRNILAVIVGVILGGLVNLALVTAGPHLVPPPAGVNMGDAKSLAENIHRLEPRHFIFPFLAHALGTLVGALNAHVAAATRRSVPSYVVGGVFLAGGIAAANLIPAPLWFIVLDLVGAYLPMAWLATKLGYRLRAPVIGTTG